MMAALKERTVRRETALNRWERSQLCCFERCGVDELAAFSNAAIAEYRALMLKYLTATAGVGREAPSPRQVS